MHKTKEQLYNQIKDIKTEKEFKKEIAELQKEYDGLFDEDIAALLIVDELGRNKENILKILEKSKRLWIEKLRITLFDSSFTVS